MIIQTIQANWPAVRSHCRATTGLEPRNASHALALLAGYPDAIAWIANLDKPPRHVMPKAKRELVCRVIKHAMEEKRLANCYFERSNGGDEYATLCYTDHFSQYISYLKSSKMIAMANL
jgi:hypothetical protein